MRPPLSFLLITQFLLLSLLSSKTRTNKLFGNSTLGYFYLEAYLGSDQQLQTLILDTGSYNIIIPCTECLECGTHDHPYFHPASSSSFLWINSSQSYFNWTCIVQTEQNKCLMLEGYLEGSMYQGKYALDSFVFEHELHLISGKENTVIIGCASIETNAFFNQKANGILGLAPDKPGSIRPPSVLEIELQENRIHSNSFSLCIGRNGGQIGFGGKNEFTHISSANATLLDSSNLSWEMYYFTNLDGFEVF